MTNVNENQSLSCEFGSQLAAYLYDEIAEAEKSKFESHLANCENCAEEFADFSVLHDSILKWRQTDFEPLKTPVFVFPATQKTKTESGSWFAGLRSFFVFSAARTAFFAVATVLLFSIAIFWFFSSRNQTPELAKTEEHPHQTIFESKENDAQVLQPVSEATPQVSGKTITKTESSLPVKNSPSPAKVSAPPSSKPQNIQQAAPNQMPRVKTPSKNTAPVIENEDEDEDNSLRLSDMFDEIGMNSSAGKNSEENVNDE